MRNALLGKPLMKSLERQELSKKYLAFDSGTPQSTVSDHTKGKQPVDVNKAIDYAVSLQDSAFNLEVAYIFFGTISSMTGDKYQRNPLALDILQLKESNERKAKKEKALDILTMNSQEISKEQKNVIFDYASEYLDEIMLETSLLVSLLDICEISITEAVNQRMSYWKQKGYMN